MRTLLIDLELLPSVVFTFGMHTTYINPKDIIKEGSIICGSYMVLEEDSSPSTISILDYPAKFRKSVYDDSSVVKDLKKIIDSADIAVAHNGDRFDIKVMNWRLRQAGIKPLRKTLETVDTLKESRKLYRPPSHGLDYLTGGGKLPMAKKIWHDIGMKDFGGCPRTAEVAIKKMIRYCENDIKELKGLYKQEMTVMKKHPNLLVYEGKDYGCPRCGDEYVIKNGKVPAGRSVYQRYLCRHCGYEPRGGRPLATIQMI